MPGKFRLEAADDQRMNLNFADTLDECLKGFISIFMVDKRGSQCEQNITARIGYSVKLFPCFWKCTVTYHSKFHWHLYSHGDYNLLMLFKNVTANMKKISNRM